MDEKMALNQAAIAVIAVHFIEMLKRSKLFPWIDEHSDKLNRAISFLIALLTSAGLQFAFSGSLESGGSLEIKWQAAAKIWQAIAHTALQGGLQQIYYTQGIKKPE